MARDGRLISVRDGIPLYGIHHCVNEVAEVRMTSLSFVVNSGRRGVHRGVRGISRGFHPARVPPSATGLARSDRPAAFME